MHKLGPDVSVVKSNSVIFKHGCQGLLMWMHSRALASEDGYQNTVKSLRIITHKLPINTTHEYYRAYCIQSITCTGSNKYIWHRLNRPASSVSVQRGPVDLNCNEHSGGKFSPIPMKPYATVCITEWIWYMVCMQLDKSTYLIWCTLWWGHTSCSEPGHSWTAQPWTSGQTPHTRWHRMWPGGVHCCLRCSGRLPYHPPSGLSTVGYGPGDGDRNGTSYTWH